MLSQLLANSTSPLILISGIGILLLVISNRITHVIDRIRELSSKLDKEHGTTAQTLQKEIQTMMKRAHALRISMVSLCASILSSSLLLVVSTLGIVIAAVALLRDIIYSLHALKLDLQQIDLEGSG
ncbi:MAG: DUF2721 domain-containing protein [Sulfurimonadaceae bacterium]